MYFPETVTTSINHFGYFNDDDRADNYVFNTTYYVKYDYYKVLDIILYAIKITFTFTDEFANVPDKVLKLNLTLTRFHPSSRPSDRIRSGDWVTKKLSFIKGFT